MFMTLNLAIAGVAGRMGRSLILAGCCDARFKVVGGTDRAGSELIGTDLSLLDGKMPCGHIISDTVEAACAGADVWIDFTSPSATLAALSALKPTQVKAVIIGTTGFDAVQIEAIKTASDHFAIVMSGNFSLGVNLVAGLVRQAAARLGPDWDIEILESHHRHKVDAPSGTALMLGHTAAAGRGVDHDQVAKLARHGQVGPRTAGDIGYAVIRAGGIIGDHEVMFASEDEIVTIAHKASSRTIFAKGALEAAAWASTKKSGLYIMDDVLDL